MLKTPPLESVDLSKSYKKKKYKKLLEKEQKELYRLQYSVIEKKIPVVCVFEGWDAAGKGGCIKRLTRAVNPRFYSVVPIGSPSQDEKKYHYMYRFLDGIPNCGHITIYDRSWYGRVMVERIEGFATEEEWKSAYYEINAFEKMLTSFGIVVLKFWLHMDKDKQYERFMERKNDPLKQWKLTDEDWRNREKWDEYFVAVNEMIEKTSTKKAPWIIIPANDQRYARVEVLKEINKAIKEEISRVEKKEKKEKKEKIKKMIKSIK